jgi:hypothetical protein
MNTLARRLIGGAVLDRWFIAQHVIETAFALLVTCCDWLPNEFGDR